MPAGPASPALDFAPRTATPARNNPHPTHMSKIDAAASAPSGGETGDRPAFVSFVKFEIRVY
jgi:hypothetical protein